MVRITRLVGKAMNAVSIFLMVALCIPIAYEAIARSLGAPTTWVFEITLYAFIFLGFLGNTLAVQSGAHFRVTVMRDLFPNCTACNPPSGCTNRFIWNVFRLVHSFQHHRFGDVAGSSALDTRFGDPPGRTRSVTSNFRPPGHR
jgi:hypothetical protein